MPGVFLYFLLALPVGLCGFCWCAWILRTLGWLILPPFFSLSSFVLALSLLFVCCPAFVSCVHVVLRRLFVAGLHGSFHRFSCVFFCFVFCACSGGFCGVGNFFLVSVCLGFRLSTPPSNPETSRTFFECEFEFSCSSSCPPFWWAELHVADNQRVFLVHRDCPTMS